MDFSSGPGSGSCNLGSWEIMYSPIFIGIHSSPKDRQLQKCCKSFETEYISQGSNISAYGKISAPQRADLGGPWDQFKQEHLFNVIQKRKFVSKGGWGSKPHVLLFVHFKWHWHLFTFSKVWYKKMTFVNVKGVRQCYIKESSSYT